MITKGILHLAVRDEELICNLEREEEQKIEELNVQRDRCNTRLERLTVCVNDTNGLLEELVRQQDDIKETLKKPAKSEYKRKLRLERDDLESLIKLQKVQRKELVATAKELSKRRDKIVKQIETITESQRKRELRIQCCYQSTVRGLVLTINETPAEEISDERIRYWGRQISNTIYDTPAKWTRHASQEVVDAIEAGKKRDEVVCEEHYIPRQFSGEAVVKYIMKHGDCPWELFRSHMRRSIWVHHTTSKENTRLVPYQNSEVFTDSHESYEKACIKLHKVDKNYNIISS